MLKLKFVKIKLVNHKRFNHPAVVVEWLRCVVYFDQLRMPLSGQNNFFDAKITFAYFKVKNV